MTIPEIKHELLTQDNRSTSWPIFIIVEDRKVYGVGSDWADGKERKEEHDEALCDDCEACIENGPEMPEDCENCPDDAFIYYKIEKDVPNLYGGFFFTAKAAQEHLDANRHHYNSTAHTYAISATHNSELQTVINYLKI